MIWPDIYRSRAPPGDAPRPLPAAPVPDTAPAAPVPHPAPGPSPYIPGHGPRPNSFSDLSSAASPASHLTRVPLSALFGPGRRHDAPKSPVGGSQGPGPGPGPSALTATLQGHPQLQLQPQPQPQAAPAARPHPPHLPPHPKGPASSSASAPAGLVPAYLRVADDDAAARRLDDDPTVFPRLWVLQGAAPTSLESDLIRRLDLDPRRAPRTAKRVRQMLIERARRLWSDRG
eukprot:tig00000385_g24734.t1